MNFLKRMLTSGEVSHEEARSTSTPPEAAASPSGPCNAQVAADAELPAAVEAAAGPTSQTTEDQPRYHAVVTALRDVSHELNAQDDEELAAMNGSWQSVREEEQRAIHASQHPSQQQQPQQPTKGTAGVPHSAFLMTVEQANAEDDVSTHQSNVITSMAAPAEPSGGMPFAHPSHSSVGRGAGRQGHSVRDPENVRPHSFVSQAPAPTDGPRAGDSSGPREPSVRREKGHSVLYQTVDEAAAHSRHAQGKGSSRSVGPVAGAASTAGRARESSVATSATAAASTAKTVPSPKAAPAAAATSKSGIDVASCIQQQLDKKQRRQPWSESGNSSVSSPHSPARPQGKQHAPAGKEDLPASLRVNAFHGNGNGGAPFRQPPQSFQKHGPAAAGRTRVTNSAAHGVQGNRGERGNAFPKTKAVAPPTAFPTAGGAPMYSPQPSLPPPQAGNPAEVELFQRFMMQYTSPPQPFPSMGPGPDPAGAASTARHGDPTDLAALQQQQQQQQQQQLWAMAALWRQMMAQGGAPPPAPMDPGFMHMSGGGGGLTGDHGYNPYTTCPSPNPYNRHLAGGFPRGAGGYPMGYGNTPAAQPTAAADHTDPSLRLTPGGGVLPGRADATERRLPVILSSGGPGSSHNTSPVGLPGAGRPASHPPPRVHLNTPPSSNTNNFTTNHEYNPYHHNNPNSFNAYPNGYGNAPFFANAQNLSVSSSQSGVPGAVGTSPVLPTSVVATVLPPPQAPVSTGGTRSQHVAHPVTGSGTPFDTANQNSQPRVNHKTHSSPNPHQANMSNHHRKSKAGGGGHPRVRGSHDNTPQEKKYMQTDPFSMYHHNKTLLAEGAAAAEAAPAEAGGPSPSVHV